MIAGPGLFTLTGAVVVLWIGAVSGPESWRERTVEWSHGDGSGSSGALVDVDWARARVRPDRKWAGMTMLETDLEAELLALGRVIGRANPMGWLRDRWKHLDEFSPQLVTVEADHLRSAGSGGLDWVAADLVAYVDDDGDWGEANTRSETYLRFMNALVAADEGSIKDWIDSVGHPPLMEMAGPYGPLYQAGGDGRHRTAILKALGIQWDYEVSPQRGLEAGEQFLVAMTARIPDQQERRRHEQAVRDELDHLELLTRAGLVEPVGRTYAFGNRSYEVTASLPFPWALRRPAGVAAASRRYKQSYRHFGAIDAERASLEAGTWSQHLTGLAERLARVWKPIQKPLVEPDSTPVEDPGSTRTLA